VSSDGSFGHSLTGGVCGQPGRVDRSPVATERRSHLAANPDFTGSVLVVERDPALTHSATMASNNCMRQQFATQINVEIAQYAATEITNLMMCNGFSGHGSQQAPACGRGVAELITYGEFRTLDVSSLAYDRIARNQPLLERAVI